MPNQGRMMFCEDSKELPPDLQAMFAPGYTVGRTAFIVT